ncbi:DUF2911 domain-containing protein [Tenacibaculum maritimum]|uniref:DUF2911 domain-containing protein n=1 Tax=Tenacibaculum maritimum TaxID=107401 RepID=UPI001E28E107|nr:DUF2911 domain-containing protein [Tenacibaculum maritimum]MCD9585482.1 DUF2911 domain-containing protein [Tenacibaculum maritimum]MCD9611373.1 DUF2911 domain-containing protein [Tenacibaculum maritimum]MCD9621415.1 DUF2911 domain-containing protein [Tenacibaculum maritimum]MCD9627905.1 DUF2911 domain-containing protein [Tenacibaculum maritimum]MCD9631157.1 DUF2911 domain-containing protein [Tenacibaculum maritimum]
MKKILLNLLIITATVSTNAQVKTPQPSPSSKIEQKVGLTDVTLEYSRPGMRGRAIFGDLVPFGKTWRTGANANTKITFTDHITIGGKELKEGTYAIYTIPNKNSWEVIFYNDSSNWGVPEKWDETKVALRTSIKPTPISTPVETFTITFDNLKNNAATLGILWDKTYVGIPFSVPTDSTVSASINKTMQGPSANDYYKAAVYYLQENKDINQAKTWINKAVAMTKDQPRFWFLRQQSLILAKAGDKKGAIKAAKASLAGAKKRGNAGYVKMNQEFLAKMK